MEDELNQLQSWKTIIEKKFELSERERKELEQSIGRRRRPLRVRRRR